MIVAQLPEPRYSQPMRPAFIYALMFCLAPGFAAAEVYRSVDEHGNVVYSDQPGQGAKKVDLPEISTYEPKPIPPGTLQPEPQPPAATSNSVSFVQPGAEETIFDNEGNVAVAVRVEPPLGPGQRLALQLDDGAPVEVSEPTYQFSGVNRGSHTLQAWVVGANGETIGDQASVTFYLRQASKLFRNPGPQSGPVQQAPRAPQAPTAPNFPSAGGS